MGRPEIAAIIALGALGGCTSAAAAPVPSRPALRMDSSMTPIPMIIGTESVYAMTVTNPDAQDASDVTITATLDQHVTPGRLPLSCSLTTRTVTCGGTGLTIPAGRSVRYEIPLTTGPALPDGTPIVNRAHVTGGDATQLVSRAQAVSDVEIVADGPAHAKTGTGLPYTLTVTNRGPSRAEDVTVQSPAPGDRATIAAGPAECPGNGLACHLGGLAPAETRTLTYTIVPDVPGVLENCATVETSGRDDDLGDNRTCADTTVRPAPTPRPRPSAPTPRARGERKTAERPPEAEAEVRPRRHREPRPAPVAGDVPAVPPPAHHRDPGSLALTGASLWMLGLGVAVLLAIGLLVHCFSRREKTPDEPARRTKTPDKAGRAP
ncbi:hypothetical protein [Nonomuraea sp. NPDC050643]|uniref:hypothetical protein n=1 Tax=Nonomuraea sp. NPDC050643 TaxID=3155660 RepID=UPI0033E2521C